MRTHYLFPLLSGLVLAGLTACGDDSSGDDSSDDVTEDAGGNTETDPTDTDPTDTDPTDTDPTDTDPTDTDPTDTDPTDTDPTGTDTGGEGDGGVDGGPGGGEGDGGVDGGGGGGEGDDGGVDGGGDLGGDGGADGGEEDAAPPLPEGACAESPEDPEDGVYAECDATLNGGTCQLTCTDEDFIGGQATCTDGVWVPAECVPLGVLEATIGNAADGTAIEDATVYVAGFFDPQTQVCEESDYCTTSDADGLINFDAFPTGPQNVVIVADGFDEIALPVEIAPGDTEAIHLDALPSGFLDGNIVVVLNWSARRDLDLVINAPVETADGGAGECVYFDAPGSLEETPFAQHDHDTKTVIGGGTETLRVALNEEGTGPHFGGTYNIVVHTGVEAGLESAVPTVRVIREGANGAAEVTLFQLPEDAVEGATEWHVVDLYGDGTLTAGGGTEANEGVASEFPCIDLINEL